MKLSNPFITLSYFVNKITITDLPYLVKCRTASPADVQVNILDPPLSLQTTHHNVQLHLIFPSKLNACVTLAVLSVLKLVNCVALYW